MLLKYIPSARNRFCVEHILQMVLVWSVSESSQFFAKNPLNWFIIQSKWFMRESVWIKVILKSLYLSSNWKAFNRSWKFKNCHLFVCLFFQSVHYKHNACFENDSVSLARAGIHSMGGGASKSELCFPVVWSQWSLWCHAGWLNLIFIIKTELIQIDYRDCCLCLF